MVRPRFTTFGRYDMDRICAVVVCLGKEDVDGEVSRKWSQAHQLLQSIGMDIIPAVPEGQEPRRPWWRRFVDG